MGRKLSRRAAQFDLDIQFSVSIWHQMIRNGWKASEMDFFYGHSYTLKDRSPYVIYRLKQIIKDCYERSGEEYSDT